MRRVFKNFTIILILSILNFSAFARDFKIYAVKEKNETVTDYDSKSVISAISKDGIQFSVSASKDLNDSSIKYAVNINNLSSQPYDFSETDISVYEGNFVTDEWVFLPYTPASEYLEYKRFEEGVLLTSELIDISLAILNNSTKPARPYPDSYKFHKKNGITPNKNNSPLPDSSKIPHNNHTSKSEPAASIDNDYLKLLNEIESNTNIKYLENKLLFSKVINPSENYSGIFFTGTGSKPDFKISIKVSNDEKINFIFSRSDREEILHPWKDKNYARHSVAFSLALPYENWGLFYIYAGTPIGAYASLNMPFARVAEYYGTAKNSDLTEIRYNDYIDSSYLYSVTPTGKTDFDMTGLSLGMNFKILPYTWILAGCGFDFKQSYYEGNIYYREKNESPSENKYWTTGWFKEEHTLLYFAPQIGVNMIFDFIDIAAIFEWRINDKPKVELLFGFSI